MNWNCVLCQSEDFELLANRDRKNRPLDTVVCRSCGLVQHHQIPTQRELSDFYADRYRLEYNGEEIPSSRRVYRDWLRAKQRFEAIRPLLGEHADVFEVGAGIGCNLLHFHNAGCSTLGIEPGRGFGRYARETLGLRVLEAELRDYQCPDRKDLILLVHVLEHLPDPVDALRHLRSMLTPDGFLFVEVPNFSIPHACPSKVFHYGHIFNFTPKTLANVARQAGFATEAIQTERTLSTNITCILRPSTEGEACCSLENDYPAAVAGFRRYSPLTYRLRGRKLRAALTKIRQRMQEALFASRQVARLSPDSYA